MSNQSMDVLTVYRKKRGNELIDLGKTEAHVLCSLQILRYIKSSIKKLLSWSIFPKTG